MIPDDYICPICGEMFWDNGNPKQWCSHTEWDIIQHLTNLLQIERDEESDMHPAPEG